MIECFENFELLFLIFFEAHIKVNYFKNEKNKDAIFTITTAAVQEIDSKQIEQQNEINELKQKNIDLETRLARLEEFISTLEITE